MDGTSITLTISGDVADATEGSKVPCLRLKADADAASAFCPKSGAPNKQGFLVHSRR